MKQKAERGKWIKIGTIWGVVCELTQDPYRAKAVYLDNKSITADDVIFSEDGWKFENPSSGGWCMDNRPEYREYISILKASRFSK